MRPILRAINKRATCELPAAYKRLRLIAFKRWGMPPVSCEAGESDRRYGRVHVARDDVIRPQARNKRVGEEREKNLKDEGRACRERANGTGPVRTVRLRVFYGVDEEIDQNLDAACFNFKEVRGFGLPTGPPSASPGNHAGSAYTLLSVLGEVICGGKASQHPPGMVGRGGKGAGKRVEAKRTHIPLASVEFADAAMKTEKED
ncbi:hypothetical protein B0H13DRAFT_1882303 [Mycena leptocephala]|nr:hypothetical protein B0H13DRAFT_1882303 [Mycena leptocephala]